MDKKFRLATVKEPEPPIDFSSIYLDACAKYDNVFIQKIDGEVYFYHALGRKDYREILDDPKFDDLKKEELICSQCLIYPDPRNYSWDNVNAGVPTELMKAILTDSYLDTVDRRRRLHDYYRSEMYDLDNQITCIISEAFPHLDIEEIEQWDVEKTTKYLSRAEWKLHNLHGIPFKEAEGSFGGEEYYEEEENYEPPQRAVQENKKNNSDSTIRGGERSSKLTPEKIKEREEFFRRHPEFAAMAAQGNIDDVEHMHLQETVDTLAPALRTPRGR